MKDSERMARNWLIDQGFSDEQIGRIDNEAPDFILALGGEKKAYVEVTECGWQSSQGEDTRGTHQDLRRIIEDEVRNVRKNGGLPEWCWIGVKLNWPYVFVPSRKSVGGARSKKMKEKIREKIQQYGEYLDSSYDYIKGSSACKTEFLSLCRCEVDAEISFWKRKTDMESDCIHIDVCEGNKGSHEASRYVSTVRNSLHKKTTEEVKSRTDGFSEYWLVLADKSFLLAGDDHKPDAEEWRRRDWDIARNEVGKNPNLEYWDRIVVVSDCNGYVEHIEVLGSYGMK